MDYGIGGRRALVTGASRGIGRAIAHTLAREGVRVALAARNEPGLEATAGAIRERGGQAWCLPTDLSAWDASATLVDRATEALEGAPEILVVSHAHFTPVGKVHTLEPDLVDRVLRTDLASVLALTGAATPEMMRAHFGRIVVVGSTVGTRGQPGQPLNSLAKAALEGLVRNLAVDFGRFGVTANVVAPGFVDTERQHERTDDPKKLETMRKAASTRRLATAEDVAEVATFLCSTAARQVTGVVLPVHGGLHLGNLF